MLRHVYFHVCEVKMMQEVGKPDMLNIYDSHAKLWLEEGGWFKARQVEEAYRHHPRCPYRGIPPLVSWPLGEQQYHKMGEEESVRCNSRTTNILNPKLVWAFSFISFLYECMCVCIPFQKFIDLSFRVCWDHCKGCSFSNVGRQDTAGNSSVCYV